MHTYSWIAMCTASYVIPIILSTLIFNTSHRFSGVVQFSTFSQLRWSSYTAWFTRLVSDSVLHADAHFMYELFFCTRHFTNCRRIFYRNYEHLSAWSHNRSVSLAELHRARACSMSIFTTWSRISSFRNYHRLRQSGTYRHTTRPHTSSVSKAGPHFQHYSYLSLLRTARI